MPSLAAIFAATLLLAGPVLAAAPRAVDADAVDGCHQAILKGQAAVSRGRIAIVGRCLKDGRWDSCPDNDNHGVAHENELRNWVAADSSNCRAALDSGAVLADFGPLACEDSWGGCDVEVPAIATLDDLAECLVCQQRGLDFALRAELGLPRTPPDDIDERRCTRRLARLVSNTVRKATFDTAACASGLAKPFACAPDSGGDSRFGRARATFAKNVASCRLDEGKAPGALAGLCGGDAADAAGLTTCLEGVAICLACQAANAALGQGLDCAALSGFARCDGTF